MNIVSILQDSKNLNDLKKTNTLEKTTYSDKTNTLEKTTYSDKTNTLEKTTHSENKIHLKKNIMNNINIINSSNNNTSYLNELYFFIKKDKKIQISENSNGVFFNLNSLSEHRLLKLLNYTICILNNINKLLKENDILSNIKEDLNKFKKNNYINSDDNNNDNNNVSIKFKDHSILDKLIINYSLNYD